MTTHMMRRGIESKRQLPDGWRWARVGEVCEIIAGQSPPGETYRKTPEGLPFFQGKADFGLKHPVARVWCVAPTKIAVPGDILISVRAPVGPTNVADVECCIGRGLAAIRPGIQVDRDFILWAVRLLEDQLAELGSGSTFDAIKRNHLESIEIPLPPLSEQRRIAAILSEQMEAVERAREAAEARLEAARVLPAAYLRAGFSSPEAQQWPRERLGQILHLRNQVVHPGDNAVGQETFVGLEHIEPGTGKRTGSIEVDKASLTGRKPQFFKEDIVYGYLRPYLNKVWVADFDGLCSVDQYVFSVDRTKTNAAFVAWFMRSPIYLARAPIGLTPGQLPRIRTEEVSSVELNLPPLSEQDRTVGKLTGKMTVVGQLCKELEEELDAISNLPAALLRRAFKGGL